MQPCLDIVGNRHISRSSGQGLYHRLPSRRCLSPQVHRGPLGLSIFHLRFLSTECMTVLLLTIFEPILYWLGL